MELHSKEDIIPEIEKLIKDQFNLILDELSIQAALSRDTRIYGKNGLLNSMQLVLLIVEIEQAIHDKFNKQVILANEKALSQNNSPFHTIETLTTYIAGLLTEE